MFQKGHKPWNTGITLNSKLKRDDQPNRFSKGNKFGHLSHTLTKTKDEHIRDYIRPCSAGEYSLLTKSSKDDLAISTADCDGNHGKNCILRSTSNTSSNSKLIANQEQSPDNLVVNFEKMMEMISETCKVHAVEMKSCKEPNIYVADQEKTGLCWKIQLACGHCEFVSKTFRLYKEAKQNNRGRNPSAINVSMAVALQDSPLGAERFTDILRTMGITPPTKHTMQRLMNKVGDAVQTLNHKDMATKVELIKDVNRKRGNAEREINVSVDGRYNSHSLVSRHRPGHGANQAFSLAVENNTDHKYIIACAVQNKLCWTGAWMRSKGMEVNCPGGHAECTANLAQSEPFSEFVMGKDIGNQLALQDVLVRYVTTDGDSQGAKGVASGIKALYPLWEVSRLADTVHLGQAQFRATYRANFSDTMFHGRTKEQNRELQKQFSIDIKTRCSLITKKLFREFNGDISDIGECLPKVLEVTLQCYAGDCSQCRNYALVCNGAATDNWWLVSNNLSTYNITELKMNDNDKFLVQEILKMKLSVQALETYKLFTDTNKNEALHHAASVSMPKNNDFARNMEGRLHSFIHRSNNLPGTSAIQKCEFMGIEITNSTVEQLNKMDKRSKYYKAYVKRATVRLRKQVNFKRKVAAHRYRKDAKRTDYRKGRLDPTLPSTASSQTAPSNV
ncbi:hypothetical protein FSP39_018102 [Pinctada imbricata]|uniref:Mutator-like transposase domain-containing protein n=1 Tax=Pinctada imbricata TaxID=66713 RepID=A0AA89C421_PINIB|nr:hypothetical protein FSP39_018102 [Pinctada imbricata]